MKITQGKIITAKKVVVYGTEGIGKSTFAAQFPDPLFIDTEGSTKELDVRRFEKPSSWEMLKEQAEYVKKNKPCKTLVIDTIDWAEQLCQETICARHNKKGIEDFGYGNGYVYEKEEFAQFLRILSEVVDLGIHVVLTAHSVIRRFEQPDEMGGYDRYELKLGKKTTNMISPLIKEWADMVLFANYKTFSVATDDSGRKHKAQGGQRVMYTTHHPCWDAKNRYGLQEQIPMDYQQIRAIIEVSASTAVPEKTEPKARAETVSKIEAVIEPEMFDDGIPQALLDLMKASNITEEQVRQVVFQRGYYPVDMPMKDYPSEFVQGVLIGAWDQVKEMILASEDLPFEL